MKMDTKSNLQISPPTGQILSLITSLSNPANHALHTAALSHQTTTLSSSPLTYSSTCIQYARVLACTNPDQLTEECIQEWSKCDGGISVMQLKHDPIGGWNQLREMAGLLLKNAMVKPPSGTESGTGMRMRLLPDAAQEIKHILCRCILDSNAGVRRVGSSIISSCSVGSGIGAGGVSIADGMEALPLQDNSWGEGILTPFLVNCLESAIGIMNANDASSQTTPLSNYIQYALMGSLQTLVKLLEDDAEKFERGSGAAFNKIVPALLKLLHICGETRVKVDCLKCCVYMIKVMPGSLVAQMNDFLGVLSALAGDKGVDVRKYVCRSIVTLLSVRPEYLHDHMVPVSQFMLTATSDQNEDVALEACEFWLVFSSFDEGMVTAEMVAAVESILSQLLPTLVKSMVYSEEKKEELMEMNATDGQQSEDRVQDVAPVFHRTKASKGKNGDESDEGDDDDDDDNYDDGKDWSLRTCAAASLDGLSSVFPPTNTLPVVLPVLQEFLSHADPWVREAGILALGAMEEGCAEGMYDHLPQLHPYLMNQVTASDTLPQVVCISCWTLAKYSMWAAEETASGRQPLLIHQMTEGIVGRMLDHNRKVQMASCSALGVVVENVQDLIIPYLEPVYRTMVTALDRHHTRALLVTLETFGAIAETLGAATGEGTLPSIYIPPLLHIWSEKSKANPMDRVLLPLMESIASISMSIGMSYQPWALETFESAMGTINTAMMILSVDDYYSDEDADPMVCATDVLDGLVEGLQSNFAALVSSSAKYKDHFLTILCTLVGHDVEGVRMSAYALMGDIARQCPVIMQDGTAQLITEAIACIDPMFPSVCNNAVWALGEVFLQCIGNPAALQPYAVEIVQSLISIIMGSAYGGEENPMTGLIENASTAMGRMAKVNPSFVSNDLPRFLLEWMNGCAKISDASERVDAFEGLLLAIQANPNSIQHASPDVVQTVSALLFAVMSWHIPNGNFSPTILAGDYAFIPFPADHADLHHKMGTFLHQLKDGLGDKWNEVVKHLPVNVRRLLREQYNLC